MQPEARQNRVAVVDRRVRGAGGDHRATGLRCMPQSASVIQLVLLAAYVFTPHRAAARALDQP
jgi:hypothetical protein